MVRKTGSGALNSRLFVYCVQIFRIHTAPWYLLSLTKCFICYFYSLQHSKAIKKRKEFGTYQGWRFHFSIQPIVRYRLVFVVQSRFDAWECCRMSSIRLWKSRHSGWLTFWHVHKVTSLPLRKVTTIFLWRSVVNCLKVRKLKLKENENGRRKYPSVAFRYRA